MSVRFVKKCGESTVRQYRQDPPSQCDRDLQRVVDAIYAKYGPNLSAFFRDVAREIERQPYEVVEGADRSETAADQKEEVGAEGAY